MAGIGEAWMETSVARIRRRNYDEPHGVGGRARGEQGNVGVNLAGADEGKGRHLIHSPPAFPRWAGVSIPCFLALCTCEIFHLPCERNIFPTLHADSHQR